ncbi:MAG: response regulator [Nostoc sp. ChiSLP02]|nr:response regulator [Nostoc sp. DedSLP05]MDZ8103275.1 response regulator [Nostoc sp. DedSLP01]MDZ8187722.1 response regulator [Nostoc sp. ChiSLP02]
MRTALIISSDLNNVEKLSHYLEENGYLASHFFNDDTIQEIINLSKPNLIFIDIILQKRSGFEVCRKLKSNPKARKIPVVIISSGDNNIGQTWGTMLEAEAYLLKPIDKEQVAAVLQQLTLKKVETSAN